MAAQGRQRRAASRTEARAVALQVCRMWLLLVVVVVEEEVVVVVQVRW